MSWVSPDDRCWTPPIQYANGGTACRIGEGRLKAKKEELVQALPVTGCGPEDQDPNATASHRLSNETDRTTDSEARGAQATF